MLKKIYSLLLILVTASVTPAQPTLSGSISGTIGRDTYIVDGDIQIDAGQTLTIEPGCVFLHSGNYGWNIQGLLKAEGTPGDSIFFLCQDTSVNCRWNGISFQTGSSDSSIINFCVLDNYSCNYTPSINCNGGICAYSDSVTIKNSRVSHFNNWLWGGGIHLYDGSALIDSCIVVENKAETAGGICVDGSIEKNVLIRNTIIANNYAPDGCCNGGGGVSGSSMTLDHCLIYQNVTTYYGAGVMAGYAVINNCTITQNRCLDTGGGVYGYNITGKNNIIWDNQAATDADCHGTNDFTYTNCSQELLPGLGNFSLDPLFVDELNDDYHLSWVNYPAEDSTKSPCIDAGDPLSSLDPDSTIADIGAFYFDQNMSIFNKDSKYTPGEFGVTQCYPNPFNSQVSIRFNIPQSCAGSLKIYDITGREIIELTSGYLAQGEHQIVWNGDGYGSGIYFVRLEVGKNAGAKKIVMIK